MRYLKVSEMLPQLQTSLEFLQSLDAEGIVHLKRTTEGDFVISVDDAERARIVLMLTADLDVNLPGVEVIMHMRDTMLAMQRQFSEILDTLVDELRQQLRR